jgi:hypothetical protein
VQAGEPSQGLLEVRSAVRDFITRTAGRRHRVVVSRGVITVRLPQDGAPLAAEIAREFGDAVHITVGYKGFRSENSAMGSHVSGLLHDMPRELPGMHVSFDPPEITIPSGGAGSGKVIIRNTGPGELTGRFGGSAGWLRRPGSTLIIGGPWGPRAGTDKVLPRCPGDTESNWWTTGTASCEPGPHYQVPAGRYEVVVPLHLHISGERQTIAAEGCIAVVL